MNVHDAKTSLSRLLARVERGEDVIIARAGRPVARLVAVRASEPRVPGTLEGRLPERFFDPLPDEELRRWNGA